MEKKNYDPYMLRAGRSFSVGRKIDVDDVIAEMDWDDEVMREDFYKENGEVAMSATDGKEEEHMVTVHAMKWPDRENLKLGHVKQLVEHMRCHGHNAAHLRKILPTRQLKKIFKQVSRWFIIDIGREGRGEWVEKGSGSAKRGCLMVPPSAGIRLDTVLHPHQLTSG